ncbi:MAG: AMP-binding protein [Candidatus Cloacimonetes bacterium]|nr:AMP-binding protein [Candidatus Cloacimonadota bacterium]MBL7086547.1 AMP-binding protein [Candidatus Cloacimonadota bacterium]
MQLHQAFIIKAKKLGNKIAVYDQTTGKDISYSKMLIASLILSKYFSRYHGEHIGVMVPTSAGCMLSVLGSLMCGKTPVMINYATGARENSIYAQERCSFKTIITSKKLLDKLNVEPLEGMVYLEDIMESLTIFDKLKAAIKSKLPGSILHLLVHRGSENENCVILFTSGSERDPKAVQLSHKNIFHNINALPKIIDIDASDIFAATLPVFHVFGLTTTFWLPILIGASIVAHANPLDYKAICDSIKKYKVTLLLGTPAFFYGYLQKAKIGDFASIRYAIAGADKVTDQLREGYMRKHNLEIMEGYGTTETSPVISVNVPGANKPGSIGRPLPGVKVKIIDRETDKELPPNKEGKIIVKGELVMNGYLGDLEETSLRIRDGWYDTGDMGILDDDGFLWHRGRLRRFVKIGGEMVSLVRVENILEKLLPEDAVCCVVDVPNPKKGSDIVAAVTTKEINKKQIQKKMAKELPSIAIPKEFHVIEDIPIMPSGKVNFREVEKICRKLENDKTN